MSLVGLLVCSGFACGASPGSRDIGDSCECRADCRSDLYCAHASGHIVEDEEHGALGGICSDEGTCIPRRTADEPCDEGFVCARELICLVGAKVCADAQPEGASCGASSDCQEGLFCNTALEAAACSRPGGVGAVCGETAQCLAGLSCNTGYDPGRCEEPHLGGMNDPCSDDAHCGASLMCYHTSYCEAVGSDGAIYHASPATCTLAGTAESGAPCQQDEHCTSGRCLETQTGICTNRSCA